VDFIKTVNGSGIWNVGSGLPHSFLDLAEYIAEQEGVELRTVSAPPEENDRMRWTTCADLTLLKQTVGKRKWLNVYEWLDHETGKILHYENKRIYIKKYIIVTGRSTRTTTAARTSSPISSSC
jgi:hypothetical protein